MIPYYIKFSVQTNCCEQYSRTLKKRTCIGLCVHICRWICMRMCISSINFINVRQSYMIDIKWIVKQQW